MHIMYHRHITVLSKSRPVTWIAQCVVHMRTRLQINATRFSTADRVHRVYTVLRALDLGFLWPILQSLFSFDLESKLLLQCLIN